MAIKDACGVARWIVHICTVEQARYAAWKREHIKTCLEFAKRAHDPLRPAGPDNPVSPLGGDPVIGLYIEENSICWSVEVRCKCGASENITHIEHW